MLSDQELRDIEEELASLPTRQSGCLDAMKVVQRHRGWVSDEAVEDLAILLGMSRADLDGAATFYNLIFRRPVGKHVIMVCDSVSCWIMGEEPIMDCLKAKLGIEVGQSTADGVFTLLPTVCLGHCEQAPAMMLDGEVIGNLTEPKIDEILAGLREG